jgi:hypothetical protein
MIDAVVELGGPYSDMFVDTVLDAIEEKRA